MERNATIDLSDRSLALPCFFPSISSVKTNLKPIEYLKILVTTKHPLFLISAYDIYYSSKLDKRAIKALLRKAKQNGQYVLLDSGNFESYWIKAKPWNESLFHKTISDMDSVDFSFCFDEQNPSHNPHEIVSTITRRVVKQDKYLNNAFSAPILHAPKKLLPETAAKIADKLAPIFISIPERLLGDGILERTSTLLKIRRALNAVGTYYPIHLLGTGNPLSILIYVAYGADSFDGLEWCQTTVDPDSGLLYHFQHREMFEKNVVKLRKRENTSYIGETLVYNLLFYNKWMAAIQEKINARGNIDPLLKKYFSKSFLNKLNEIFVEV